MKKYPKHLCPCGKETENRKFCSPECRRKYCYTPEVREKIKNSLKTRYLTEKFCWIGRKHTLETKQKMSEYRKGKKASLELRMKFSEMRKGEKHSLFGKHHSEEAKQKMRIAKENYKKEKHPQYDKCFSFKYSAVHAWVKSRKSKLKFCELCQENRPLELANISGHYYRDTQDYKWVCHKCHMTKMHPEIMDILRQSNQKRKK